MEERKKVSSPINQKSLRLANSSSPAVPSKGNVGSWYSRLKTQDTAASQRLRSSVIQRKKRQGSRRIQPLHRSFGLEPTSQNLWNRGRGRVRQAKRFLVYWRTHFLSLFICLFGASTNAQLLASLVHETGVWRVALEIAGHSGSCGPPLTAE